jgi:hypothetical protein
MSNDAAPTLVIERTPVVYTYETLESLHTIATRIQHITSTTIETIALVTIALHFENEERISAYQSMGAYQSAAYLLDNLRPLVRRTDVVLLLAHKHTFYFLLLGANRDGGQIVQTRLWDALLWRIHNSSPGELLRPRSMSIGHSAYPIPSANIEEFLAAAGNTRLHFDWHPEKSARKVTARQIRHDYATVTDEDLPALARKLGIPYVSLLPRKLPERLQHLVNRKLAQELHCFPIGRERNILTVAMLNPQDRSALDRLSRETGMQIFPVLAHPHQLQLALEQLI